jgi:hypothetical protein
MRRTRKMNRENYQQPSYVDALFQGNLPLMRIRLDEEYASTFDKYERLIAARTNLLSEGLGDDESPLILDALNQVIKQQACELRIQDRIGEGAIEYLKGLLEGEKNEN